MIKLETKSVVLLHHHLKALRLPTMGAEAEKVAARCASDNADHLSYLLQLTELELLERERRAAERRLKAARLPVMKSLETFDFGARPSVNKPMLTQPMDKLVCLRKMVGVVNECCHFSLLDTRCDWVNR